MNKNIVNLKIKKEKRNILILQCVLVVSIFSFWEVFSQIGILDKFLFLIG